MTAADRADSAAVIDRLAAADLPASVPGLARLLVDTVADGASLGFLDTLDVPAASAWWLDRRPAIADGSLAVWVARGGAAIVGTVSLALEAKPNGRHRAEVSKLMVHPDARGHSLGRDLLATAEKAAARAGATLLLLDTETDSPAERLYRVTGWTRYGIVPGYAADPGGTPRDCSFFYKRLG
ncbi:MAG TPA: GNAT family N-acetyltransferase [Pseudonocardia sp.]|nr:GNAT family N-acetyltransferase [Pseudonocardia sp.]